MKKIKIIGKLFIVLLLIFSTSCKKDKEEEDEVLTPSSLQIKSFSEGSVGFYYNPPTLVNGYIYIGTSRGSNYSLASDNSFFKLDNNLNKVWRFSLGSKEVLGAATLDNDGNVYFVVGENRTSTTYFSTIKLYSLSNNGDFRWERTIWENTTPGFGWMGISSPAISVDDIIYVGGSNLYAFDKDGNEQWNYVPEQSHNPILNAPIIDPDGNIYFIKNGLTSLDQFGNERWVSSEAANGIASPAFSTDYSKIFFTNIQNQVVCVNAMNGSLEWIYTIPGLSGEFRGTPAVDNNDNVYIGTHGEYPEDNRQTLYAIKGDGTGLLWQNNLGSDLYSSPALGDDGLLYIGSEGHGKTSSNFNRLHAVNMNSGTIAWSAQLEMDITWSSACISNDGTLYIASMDMYSEGRKGMVYSFNTTSTGLLPNSGSPRYHGGNSSTGRRD